MPSENLTQAERKEPGNRGQVQKRRKSAADEIGLVENSSIQVMIKDGTLVVTPDREPEWRLEELLEKVTEDNIHREWETGSPEGDEKW